MLRRTQREDVASIVIGDVGEVVGGGRILSHGHRRFACGAAEAADGGRGTGGGETVAVDVVGVRLLVPMLVGLDGGIDQPPFHVIQE